LLTSSLSLKYKATITTELSNIREKSCETFANDKAKFQQLRQNKKSQ